MKRYSYLLILIIQGLLAVSCSDWLDVRSEDAVKEKDLFRTYKGFRDALTGCYMQMASEDIYGQRLTMTNIESLAAMWYCPSSYETTKPEAYQLHNHRYSDDDARSAIQAIYGGLFNTIAQANLIIKHVEEDGDAITDSKARACIGGEAYAIRAYCQLDVLRLFGQVPQDATRKVSLPYSFVTGIDSMPTYYDFEEYCRLLEADIDQALALLEQGDPIMEYSYSELNSGVNTGANASDLLDDEYFYYRQSRLNYYAVKALECRFLLYVGRTEEAHRLALDLIQATGPDGTPVMQLSGAEDLAAGFHACPSECFFYLSKYDILSSANQLLVGGRSVQATASQYYLTPAMFTQLYASILNTTGSHNRYNKQWNQTNRDNMGTTVVTTKKYWYDEDDDNVMKNVLTKGQIIPMLRLSEIYLIAVETSETTGEANQLYADYEKGCEVILPRTFTTMVGVKNEMLNEYRREFFAEGQMFYAYKRLNNPAMLWASDAISEQDYVLPLPSTEYNPAINTN